MKAQRTSPASPHGLPTMKLDSLPVLLDATAVGMDPVLDGFSSVLVEIYRERDPSGAFRYFFLQTACATGNQLLKFSSKDKG
jgi:hypothetical protein